jgi:hypothetical protein
MNRPTYPGPIRDLLESFDLIEKQFELSITDGDFAVGRQQLLHIFNHETLHAVISHKVPWVHNLEEAEETLVDEILVRVLDRYFVDQNKLGKKPGPRYVPDPAKDVRGMAAYGISLTAREFEDIVATWKKRFGSPDTIEPMAQWLLEEHRAGRIVIDPKDTYGYG